MLKSLVTIVRYCLRSAMGQPKCQPYPRKVPLNFTPHKEVSVESLPQYEVNISINEHGVSTTSAKKEVSVHSVDIQNARTMNYSLDKEGFILIDHSYEHVNYYDNEEVVATYYPELEARIKAAVPNSAKVFVFAHQVRSWRQGHIISGEQVPKNPVQFCHSDFSIAGAINRLKSMAACPSSSSGGGSGSELDSGCAATSAVTPLPPPGPLRQVLTDSEVHHYLRKGRFMIIHAWRNISEDMALRRHPLALCCSNSVEDSDLLAYDLTYRATVVSATATAAAAMTAAVASASDFDPSVADLPPTGRLSCLMVRHNPRQRWASYPAMLRDELLLFKQFDSHSTYVRQHGHTAAHGAESDSHADDEVSPSSAEFTSCFVPHCAFEDVHDGAACAPYLPDGSAAPGRESIEAGVLVLLE